MFVSEKLLLEYGVFLNPNLPVQIKQRDAFCLQMWIIKNVNKHQFTKNKTQMYLKNDWKRKWECRKKISKRLGEIYLNVKI